MVVPTAAGGVMDLVARIFAGRLSEILGQPVIVENVGNGVPATSRVAKASAGRLSHESQRRRQDGFPSDGLQNAGLQCPHGFRAGSTARRAAFSSGPHRDSARESLV